MKKFWITLMIFGLAGPMFAQIIKTEELSEVTVYATNYKYLNSLDSEEPAAIPVEMLERKVAAFDVLNSEFYNDEYDLYQISFYIPEGKILAAYDKEGKIIRTVEKFRDVNVPLSVKNAILDRFPEWTITKDYYVVRYHDNKGAEKTYKLTLENGDKRLKVKLDEKGHFL